MKKSFFLAAVCFAGLSTVFTACNKLSKSTYLPVSDTIVIKPKVIVVDSARYHLLSTDDQLANGTYVFGYDAQAADLRHNGDFAPGVIIVGVTGQGYLRKVISVSAGTQTINVYTTAAKLEDVFETGSFTISAASVASPGPGAGTGVNGGMVFGDSIRNRTLVNENGTVIRINSGAFTTNASWNYGFNYRLGTLQDFTAACENSNSSAFADVTMSATSNSAVNTTDSTLLRSYSKQMMLGKIPVVARYDVYLKYKVVGTVPAGTNNNMIATSHDTFSILNIYAGNNWMNNSHFQSNASLSVNVAGETGNGNVYVQMGIETVFSLYGYQAAVEFTPVTLDITATSNATNDKELTVIQQLSHTSNEKAYVYGYTPLEHSQTFATDAISFISPYQLVKISGDNQSGASNQYLSLPLRVQAKDKNGAAAKNIRVQFTVISGGGRVSVASTTTDASGMAQTNWLKGASGAQIVQATVFDGSGNAINGAPVTFTAN